MAISFKELAKFFFERGVTLRKVFDKLQLGQLKFCRREMRLLKKYHEFNFEGIVIKVLSEYDDASGKYISEIPDLEEEPVYTPSGKPLVAAVQDRCSFMLSDGAEADCGSCKFYQPNHPGDLIGVCTNPKKNKNRGGNIK